MKLNTGNMDKVQTKPDVLPALRNVLFEVIEPQDRDSLQQEFKDGGMKAIRLPVRIAEPTPYTVEMPSGELVKRDAQGRVLSVTLNYEVSEAEFLSWKGSSKASYDAKEYLRNLKRFGEAISLDFATGDVEDSFGRFFRADIAQRAAKGDDSGEPAFNDVKNYRANKS